MAIIRLFALLITSVCAVNYEVGDGSVFLHTL